MTDNKQRWTVRGCSCGDGAGDPAWGFDDKAEAEAFLQYLDDHSDTTPVALIAPDGEVTIWRGSERMGLAADLLKARK